ncbi:MAG: acyltransferase family protein [Eubacterium sp.]|nr:acyltransferase family protein [Eubacterium sp.]
MGNSHSSKFRQSNIELLRILATLGVIILHYNNPSIGGGIAYTQGASRIMLFAFEALNICAVNLFVLISGYFLSRSQERDLLKPVKLVVPVIIYSVVYYLYRVLVEGKEFSLRHFIRICIPTNWYVILYVALFLISPYINVVLDYLKKNHALRRFILIVVCTFSVYPMLVDILQEISGTELMGLSTIGMYGSQYGFKIVNFVVLYILGAALNGYKVEKKTSTLVLLLFIDEVVIFLWAYGEFLIADRIPNGTAQE